MGEQYSTLSIIAPLLLSITCCVLSAVMEGGTVVVAHPNPNPKILPKFLTKFTSTTMGTSLDIERRCMFHSIDATNAHADSLCLYAEDCNSQPNNPA